MGGQTFYDRSKGKTPQDALNKVVAESRYNNGHGGYTGTIAEKHEFVMIDEPVGIEPEKYAEELVHKGDPRINDKCGPAGCIKLSDDEYLFFGWASS